MGPSLGNKVGGTYAKYVLFVLVLVYIANFVDRLIISIVAEEIISLFGIVALAGVVVNDSLVMVDFINRNRRWKDDLPSAIRQAGVVRFRPILLTSLTTFVGLLPLILEKSMQATFLIPMAVSLAFGVLFATFITLLLVPAGYAIVEDIKAALAQLPSRMRGRDATRPVRTSVEG